MWNRASAWVLAGNPSIQVGNILGNQDHEFYRVAHSQRLADGSIVVANTGLGDVRVFDATGGHLRTIGLGPEAGEKHPPIRIFPLGGDTLLVLQGDQSLVRLPGGAARSRRPATASRRARRWASSPTDRCSSARGIRGTTGPPASDAGAPGCSATESTGACSDPSATWTTTPC